MPGPYQKGPAPGRPGATGWITGYADSRLVNSPQAGSYPIIDGLPAGPPILGGNFKGSDRIGINGYGPQPLTGEAAQLGIGGIGQGNVTPVTIDQATYWWNQAGPAPAGITPLQPVPQGYPPGPTPAGGGFPGINFGAGGIDFEKLMNMIIMLRLLKAMG